MIRPPLFGKDSSPQYTAPRLAALITAGITFIFFILVLCIPASVPKQKYETVRIVLDTTPVEIKKEIESSSGHSPETQKADSKTESAQNKTEAIPEQPSKNIQKTTVQKPAVTSTPKTEPLNKETSSAKATTTKPVETKQYTKRTDNSWENRKTLEEQIAEQIENRVSKTVSSNIDPWSQFEDEVYIDQSSPVNQVVQTTVKESLSGSAATASNETTQHIISQTKTGVNSNIQGQADSSLESSLSKIAGTEYSEKTFSSGNSSVKINSASTSEGGTSVSFSDGSSRILLKPKEPKINVSPDQAQNLNSSTTVKITFTVLADGSVPETSVKISPASLLTAELVSDIAWQLSMWKFEKGNSNAIASFDFTIKKN